jgi:hypothetical protein
MKSISGFLSIICVGLLIVSCELLGLKDPPTYLFTAEVIPAEGGSVSPDSARFEEGETVTVRATAASGYAFESWSENITGDVTIDENSLSFEITEDTDVSASFIELRSVYDVKMTVKDDSSSMILKFGQNENSTADFDDTDKESPPPPPEGSLHSFFRSSDMDLLYDYRSDEALNVIWNLNYQVSPGSTLRLSWTVKTTLLEGSLTLRNEDSSINVDMTSQSSVDVPGSDSGSLIIEYALLD